MHLIAKSTKARYQYTTNLTVTCMTTVSQIPRRHHSSDVIDDIDMDARANLQHFRNNS